MRRGSSIAWRPEGQHLEVAHELAAEVAKNPPLSVRATVRTRRWYMDQLEREVTMQTAPLKLYLSEDFREAARAFASAGPGRSRGAEEERTMITPAYVRTMANLQCRDEPPIVRRRARLSDAERREPRGAFWGSIHGTLTHILWGDQQWMSRFDNWPRPTTPIKQSAGMIADFAALERRAREGRRRHLRLGGQGR